MRINLNHKFPLILSHIHFRVSKIKKYQEDHIVLTVVRNFSKKFAWAVLVIQLDTISTCMYMHAHLILKLGANNRYSNNRNDFIIVEKLCPKFIYMYICKLYVYKLRTICQSIKRNYLCQNQLFSEYCFLLSVRFTCAIPFYNHHFKVSTNLI